MLERAGKCGLEILRRVVARVGATTRLSGKAEAVRATDQRGSTYLRALVRQPPWIPVDRIGHDAPTTSAILSAQRAWSFGRCHACADRGRDRWRGHRRRISGPLSRPQRHRNDVMRERRHRRRTVGAKLGLVPPDNARPARDSIDDREFAFGATEALSAMQIQGSRLRASYISVAERGAIPKNTRRG